MTNRNRTNFYISKGVEKFSELVNAYYKNGCVGIVYEDEKLLDKVSKALYEKGNTIKCKHLDQAGEPFEEYVRFIIGIGGREVVNKTQRIAGNNFYSFYCAEILPDYFTNGILENSPLLRFAEFAYFDNELFNIKATEMVASGYTTLFSLFISLYDKFCMSLYKPFKDCELEMLIRKIKSFLLYKADTDLFFHEMLSLIKRSMDWLNKVKEFPLIYRIRYEKKNEWSYAREFFVAYLLFYLGLIFTKWDFNDMLIPVAIPAKTDLQLCKFISANTWQYEKLFITRKQLGYIAGVFKTLSQGFENQNLYNAMTLIKRASACTTGLFAQIHTKGIIEGIIKYEKH